MAIKSQLHVLVPVTLCFLLVAAAQGRELNVTVVVQGQAKCKNNPSAVMSHTTLHLMINGTTVPGAAASTTTSTGELVMAVNLTTTSTQQLLSIISGSSRMLVTAPPNACGAPTGSVLGAELDAAALLIKGAAGGLMTNIPIIDDELAAIEAEVARLEAERDDDGLVELRVAAAGSSTGSSGSADYFNVIPFDIQQSVPAV